MSLEEDLRKETDKWLSRLESAYKPSELRDKILGPVRENIDAYIRDCRHFMDKGDYIRAFEAVIYAWGLFEALQHIGLLRKSTIKD